MSKKLIENRTQIRQIGADLFYTAQVISDLSAKSAFKKPLGNVKIMTKPNINVTPLIDVLLVLLIIFMVVSPLKPTGFKTKIPNEPDTDNAQVKDNSHALVVSLGKDYSLKLNGTDALGTVEESDKLVAKLRTVFQERKENKAYSENAAFNASLSEDEKIEKTVFIKAPKSIDYGRVAKLIDAVKVSGANPISLQIDDLEN